MICFILLTGYWTSLPVYLDANKISDITENEKQTVVSLNTFQTNNHSVKEKAKEVVEKIKHCKKED